MNSSLFLELEAAINAVEPRVLEGYNPGLTDTEIDAIMAQVSFDLPDDLRALYRWRDGDNNQWIGILGSFQWMIPFSVGHSSSFVRGDIEAFHESVSDAPLPFDLNAKEVVPVFDDGGDGTYIIAVWSQQEKETCEIWTYIPSDFPFLRLTYRGVEPMIQTALEWWRNGVFSPVEHERDWRLETDWDKYGAIGQHLNPDCPD
jgi:hypothetical protein